MKNGIYKLVFNTNVNLNGQLDGILTVRDGHINGGDYVCYYQGILDGNRATIKSVPHNRNDTTAFNGKTPVDLDLVIEESGDVYRFKGAAKQNAANSIYGELHFLNDLV